MSRFNERIENLAVKFRIMAGLGENEPVHLKTILIKLGIITQYRPLSDNTFSILS